MTKQKQPVNLNLLAFHFPWAAVVSILHRVSGVLLFLSIPLFIYWLQLSLRSEQDYLLVLSWLEHWSVRFMLFICLWALLHHFIAGIRFLIMDLDIGLTRSQARNSAVAVLVLSIALLFALVL